MRDNRNIISNNSAQDESQLCSIKFYGPCHHCTRMNGFDHSHHFSNEVLIPPCAPHPGVHNTIRGCEVIDHVAQHMWFGLDPNHTFITKNMQHLQEALTSLQQNSTWLHVHGVKCCKSIKSTGITYECNCIAACQIWNIVVASREHALEHLAKQWWHMMAQLEEIQTWCSKHETWQN